jgi:hypothetical protein
MAPIGLRVWGGKRSQSPVSALGRYRSGKQTTPLDERSDLSLPLERRSQDTGLEMFLYPSMELGGGVYSARCPDPSFLCKSFISPSEKMNVRDERKKKREETHLALVCFPWEVRSSRGSHRVLI